MANDISAIMPKILARGLMNLRKQAIMPRIVNGSYNGDAAQKGNVINVPVPSDVAATDVAPANIPPVTPDLVIPTVPITLANWKQAPFKLTDAELLQIDRNQSFIPMQTEAAVKSLAEAVNADIMANYKGIYGFAGTPGTTPFATTVGAITEARKVLNFQKAPRTDRRAVLDFAAEANALGLPQYSDLQTTGDDLVKIEGQLGRKFGFDHYSDDDVPTHVKGVAGAGPFAVNNGAGYPVGTTTLNIDGLTVTTGQFVKGDILSFFGHSQTYVVTVTTTANGAGNASVTIAPALVSAVVDNEVVAQKGTHVVNLAFHRDAFAVAVRPLENSQLDATLANILTMTDPLTGLSMRLELSRQHKQWVWAFDILWGSALIRPELGCRIAG